MCEVRVRLMHGETVVLPDIEISDTIRTFKLVLAAVTGLRWSDIQ